MDNRDLAVPEGRVKPTWEYDARTLAWDFGAYLAYGAGTGTEFWLLTRIAYFAALRTVRRLPEGCRPPPGLACGLVQGPDLTGLAVAVLLHERGARRPGGWSSSVEPSEWTKAASGRAGGSRLSRPCPAVCPPSGYCLVNAGLPPVASAGVVVRFVLVSVAS